MFKVLNEASDDEIAIITTVINNLSKQKVKNSTISNWKLADLKNKKEIDTWEKQTLSVWKQSDKSFN